MFLFSGLNFGRNEEAVFESFLELYFRKPEDSPNYNLVEIFLNGYSSFRNCAIGMFSCSRYFAIVLRATG